ncbi:FAD-dependent oxidoreductase [Endozoicomonas sp. SM1973]|uniref:FAD-dependent oxidoreductase n=1 Tax=Spartinivicinus marinus TaxID=2994442 RepID=A0A853I3U4_9GAMM|nr:FAD-binding protein [Spartinivicinus marinus]MCX4027121.1 FAD-dependent oxidoreductase [Spartinivicinus marinus]NYZ68600.1 FAD-dependent oxidoreductase [Spartinivicinus marinus]
MYNYYDTIIIGGGLAGLVTAYELLRSPYKGSILIVEQNSIKYLGGLARQAFGGMLLVDTPLQKLNRIKDSKELASKDWLNFAEFTAEDHWPQRWAEHYIQSSPKLWEWLLSLQLRFFPVVQWVERGLYTPGNSVPRYHILWGTGNRLILQLMAGINQQNDTQQLSIKDQQVVQHISRDTSGVFELNVIAGSGEAAHYRCHSLVVAAGGVAGNLEQVKKHWRIGSQLEGLLNGSHPAADGRMHHQVKQLGGNITHLDKMWNYAAGIHHPTPQFANHGLSLIPAKSALWLNAKGERIGPEPLITGYDTHFLCQQVAKESAGYTWQVLNKRIALKEIAISGAEHNPSLRDRRLIQFLLENLRGNHQLIEYLVQQSSDVVIATSITELADKMNQISRKPDISSSTLKSTIHCYDQNINRGKQFYNDDQLRRINQLRTWRGDRVRTCQIKPIDDPKAYPLIAIKLHLISRKSLGGIQTNLASQVLQQNHQVTENLYAVGEAAGFGGGGMCGKRSLEGTFLSGCILTAMNAAANITKTQ